MNLWANFMPGYRMNLQRNPLCFCLMSVQASPLCSSKQCSLLISRAGRALRKGLIRCAYRQVGKGKPTLLLYRAGTSNTLVAIGIGISIGW